MLEPRGESRAVESNSTGPNCAIPPSESSTRSSCPTNSVFCKLLIVAFPSVRDMMHLKMQSMKWQKGWLGSTHLAVCPAGYQTKPSNCKRAGTKQKGYSCSLKQLGQKWHGGNSTPPSTSHTRETELKPSIDRLMSSAQLRRKVTTPSQPKSITRSYSIESVVT